MVQFVEIVYYMPLINRSTYRKPHKEICRNSDFHIDLFNNINYNTFIKQIQNKGNNAEKIKFIDSMAIN